MKKIEERVNEIMEHLTDKCTPFTLKRPYNLIKTALTDIAGEQKAIDDADYTEQMRQLNEEWKENLEIQRKMLTDKAWKWFWDILPDTIFDIPKVKDMFYKAMME